MHTSGSPMPRRGILKALAALPPLLALPQLTSQPTAAAAEPRRPVPQEPAARSHQHLIGVL